MTGGGAVEIRTLAFGDLETDLWAAGWIGPESFLAFGRPASGSPASTARVTVTGSQASEDWSLSGDGIELTVSPVGDPVSSSDARGLSTSCAGCTAGSCSPALSRRSRCPDGAVRARVSTSAGWTRCATSALVFGPDDAVALTALRPRRASGHGGDLVVATVFDPAGAVAVADPRLSTTYAADGSPTRAGIELWLDVSEDSDEQYPRRAAGEATGLRADATVDGLSVERSRVLVAQPGQRRRRRLPAGAGKMSRIEAVISDFGGVLTSPLLDSFVAFQDASGISLEQLGKAMAAIAMRDGDQPAVRARDRSDDRGGFPRIRSARS